MRMRLRMPLLLLASFLLFGCGPGPAKVNAPTESETATETQKVLNDFLARGKQGRVGANDVAILLETVEARAADSGERYSEIAESLRNLQSAYQQRNKADADTILQKLQKQTDALTAEASA